MLASPFSFFPSPPELYPLPRSRLPCFRQLSLVQQLFSSTLSWYRPQTLFRPACRFMSTGEYYTSLCNLPKLRITNPKPVYLATLNLYLSITTSILCPCLSSKLVNIVLAPSPSSIYIYWLFCLGGQYSKTFRATRLWTSPRSLQPWPAGKLLAGALMLGQFSCPPLF